VIQATIIADSIGDDAPRLTTYQLIYPRFIHAEVMTHRVFSRNASSSRAIPTKRMLEAIRLEPAKPTDWRMNEPGMQGFTLASDYVVEQAERIWFDAMVSASAYAEALDALGVHKQYVNRITEPFQHIRVVLTATDFDNFFALRDHPDAEPHIQLLARAMKEAMEASTPVRLGSGEYHLPYITEFDLDRVAMWLDNPENREKVGTKSVREVLCRISTARSARVSYKTNDGKPTTMEADLDLYDRLVRADLIHASPAEHQATPDHWMARGKRWLQPQLHGNLRGWQQYRKTLPNENLQNFDDLPTTGSPEPTPVAD
jgi:thymidylate synthase ThyX